MSATPAPQPPTGLLADGRLSYTFEGRPHAISGSHLSHHDLARKVRVLGRLDLNHEAVCIMARDRIAHLAERVDYLSNERFDLNRHYFDGGWDAATQYAAAERDELKGQIAENVKAMERATEFVKRAEADRNFERECLAEVEEDREAMRLAFMEVIDFAIELGREAPTFLAAWREGSTVEGADTSNEWADFRAWRKSRQEERLRVALYGDATVIRENVFGSRLYRTPYLVLPRLLLEAMPASWQTAMESLLRAADAEGFQTPNYHVLRDGSEFTFAERNDPEDEGSDLRYFTIVRPDPWANYRHGDAKKLSQESAQ